MQKQIQTQMQTNRATDLAAVAASHIGMEPWSRHDKNLENQRNLKRYSYMFIQE